MHWKWIRNDIKGLLVALGAVALLGLTAATTLGGFSATVANTTAGATDRCVYPTQVGSCPAPSSATTLAGPASQTFSTPALSALAAGGSASYVITVQLDDGATNADQGLTATIPLTWSITQ